MINTDNSKNRYSKKNINTSFGNMEIDIPGDRNRDFDPKIIKKNQGFLSKLTRPYFEYIEAWY